MIGATKTFLPPIDKYQSLLRQLWGSGQVTNNGEFVRRLEKELEEWLDVPHVVTTCNGTIALQLALEALGVGQRVVTTAFSFVATVSSLMWQHRTPIFADIEPGTNFCADPASVENALGQGAECILLTHIYGNACDIQRLQAVKERWGVPLIYDAAHTFGACYQGKALCKYGDAAVLSFHATKLFHTVEGGAVVTSDAALAEKLRLMRNFGFRDYDDIGELGINAKLSELHSGMGLVMLPYVPEIIRRRQQRSAIYEEILRDSSVQLAAWRKGLERNYAYFPVLFPSPGKLELATERLREIGVQLRRYFFPALSCLPYCGGQRVTRAEEVAERIACVPIGDDVTEDLACRIAETIKNA